MTAQQKYDLHMKSLELAAHSLSGSRVFNMETTPEEAAWFVTEMAKALEKGLRKALEDREAVLGPTGKW